MRGSSRTALGIAAVLFASSVAGDAAAYCRTSSCEGGTGTRCEPPQPEDCGVPLAWPEPCIGFDLQEDASKQVSYETALDLTKRAFGAWLGADCEGGEGPRIALYDLGPVACDKHEYNQDRGNANIIMFRDDEWPHGGGATLALTTVTYNLDTGEIYDADMELNSAQVTFSTGDSGVGFDLLSILTHETGHFLGLAHSRVEDATMFRDYTPGSTELRTLEPDDEAAICAVYPPGEPIPESCSPTPRHGFASECAEPSAEVEGGCCSVAPGAPAGREAGGLALGVAAAAWLSRRRRRVIAEKPLRGTPRCLRREARASVGDASERERGGSAPKAGA